MSTEHRHDCILLALLVMVIAVAPYVAHGIGRLVAMHPPHCTTGLVVVLQANCVTQ
jgi:hypothetical protein